MFDDCYQRSFYYYLFIIDVLDCLSKVMTGYVCCNIVMSIHALTGNSFFLYNTG